MNTSSDIIVHLSKPRAGYEQRSGEFLPQINLALASSATQSGDESEPRNRLNTQKKSRRAGRRKSPDSFLRKFFAPCKEIKREYYRFTWRELRPQPNFKYRRKERSKNSAHTEKCKTGKYKLRSFLDEFRELISSGFAGLMKSNGVQRERRLLRRNPKIQSLFFDLFWNLELEFWQRCGPLLLK